MKDKNFECTTGVNSVHMRCLFTGCMCIGTEGLIQEGLYVTAGFLSPSFLPEKYIFFKGFPQPGSH